MTSARLVVLNMILNPYLYMNFGLFNFWLDLNLPFASGKINVFKGYRYFSLHHPHRSHHSTSSLWPHATLLNHYCLCASKRIKTFTAATDKTLLVLLSVIKLLLTYRFISKTLWVHFGIFLQNQFTVCAMV